ncbi:hypothetical protein BCR33DRAFT_746003 [Rhizoclosmatium globosum]|uniref:Uncharacterized protein n=1 Tax=Rhizoclosmatium globosum TaxID=329046 RepID=A0A1Y2AY99_9FUNG|nr:hypothetical protein BCR33DRAFT_746003 [Rhizoclosmatium globosum]|eukprot:ORY27573.1 hypothetical protein BCR33DRAFT_746003 [Rhizoclosmatium globosum]
MTTESASTLLPSIIITPDASPSPVPTQVQLTKKPIPRKPRKAKPSQDETPKDPLLIRYVLPKSTPEHQQQERIQLLQSNRKLTQELFELRQTQALMQQQLQALNAENQYLTLMVMMLSQNQQQSQQPQLLVPPLTPLPSLSPMTSPRQSVGVVEASVLPGQSDVPFSFTLE